MAEIVEVIYKNGNFKVVGSPKIEGEIVKIKIINRDEILTREDIKDIFQALKEKSEGKLKKFDEVFK